MFKTNLWEWIDNKKSIWKIITATDEKDSIFDINLAMLHLDRIIWQMDLIFKLFFLQVLDNKTTSIHIKTHQQIKKWAYSQKCEIPDKEILPHVHRETCREVADIHW